MHVFFMCANPGMGVCAYIIHSYIYIYTFIHIYIYIHTIYIVYMYVCMHV
jgi:hypothetical protein